ncbi:MAG: DNA polymerase III subunit gamma/tau [Candidatus Omnitrophota bacterium]|jgi:DNA polymerase-3 subunit gamma/tau
MDYIVFARKYRPKLFGEVAGQPHITTTLKNAIALDRVAHAYLFVGPRGVGKTTAARIFAKALNCEKGTKSDPCNTCSSCVEISNGTSLDVIEIDGASNRGIDEIRNLRDSIKFAPSKGRFKIYIIDEVHMLTAEAFNALLKMLEEPPKHAKFIFATTHPHKVPPTILSRCQRFDFKRISTKDIFENLKKIVKAEKLNVKEEAISLIARYAEGSMRDGQVVLDQIVSFAEGAVGVKDVEKVLGLVEEEILSGLASAIKNKDASAALEMVNRLVEEGKDVMQVVVGLVEYFRDLSVVKIAKDPDALIEAGGDKIKSLKETAESFTVEDILYVIYTLSNTMDMIRKTNIARIPLEVALIKLTGTGKIVSLSDIMDRIKKLEGSARPSPVAREASRTPPAYEPRVTSAVSPKENAPTSPEKKETKREEKLVSTLSPAGELTAVSTQNTQTAVAAVSKVDEVLNCWADIMNNIKEKKISVASYLQEGYPVSLEGRAITLGFPKEFQFNKDMLDSLDNRTLIENTIKESCGLDLRVLFSIVESAGAPSRQSKDPSFSDAAASQEDNPDQDPIIKEALQIFGGEIPNRARDYRKA